MASGVLGTADINAETVTVYTVPANTFAVVTVNVTNRDTTSRDVSIALALNPTSPDNSEFIEFNTEILGNGTLEKSGIVIEAGRSVIVSANSTNVSAVVHGLETSTV